MNKEFSLLGWPDIFSIGGPGSHGTWLRARGGEHDDDEEDEGCHCK